MNIALILSGGTGQRLGADVPKQYIEVNGKPIIAYCMELFENSPLIDRIQVVADSPWQEEIRKWLGSKPVGFSNPGETRQLSIFNGLKDLEVDADENTNIIIHDAARPLLTEQLIRDCFDAVQEHDGVLPVLPMKDTVYLSEDGKSITSLLDRNQIFAGQAPECFNFKKYLRANEALFPEKIQRINGSTEPAILAGMDVVMVSGDERNFKITTRADLERFEEIMKNTGC